MTLLVGRLAPLPLPLSQAQFRHNPQRFLLFVFDGAFDLLANVFDVRVRAEQRRRDDVRVIMFQFGRLFQYVFRLLAADFLFLQLLQLLRIFELQKQNHWVNELPLEPLNGARANVQNAMHSLENRTIAQVPKSLV